MAKVELLGHKPTHGLYLMHCRPLTYVLPNLEMFDSLIFTCVLKIQEVELGHLKSFLTPPSLSLVTFS